MLITYQGHKRQRVGQCACGCECTWMRDSVCARRVQGAVGMRYKHTYNTSSPLCVICTAPGSRYLVCFQILTCCTCNRHIIMLFERLSRGYDTSPKKGHTKCGQAAVSRSRSQDTLLLNVSIYHRAQVKEQHYFLYPSTSHSAELFCRSITNKGNLCTANTGAPKRK